MAQPVSTQNFLIHDANGKPQVIKVVHTTTGPTKAWPQSSVVRTSNIIKSVGGPVKQLYADDDSDSPSGSYAGRRAKAASTQSPHTYKVVRRQPWDESTQKTYQIHSTYNDSIQSPSESNVRLSSGSKRAKSTPSHLKQSSPEPDFIIEPSKRRRSEKAGKGLRHFSLKVCEKVREKGTTTYNEVADELVTEFTGCAFQPNMDQNYDQKNIRRRVYDALNVLMAMNIISKEKKEIRWLGLPSGYPKLKPQRSMENEEQNAIRRVASKKKTLQTLILQQVAMKNLVERNKALEAVRGEPAPQSAIQLPLLVVSTNSNTTVNLSVSNDRKEYFFNFDDVFEIKDDTHVLQHMGMMMGLNTGHATPEELIRAKTMIPRALAPYLEEMVQMNVRNERGGEAAAAALYSTEPEEEEDEGTVYLEEDDDSATDDDMDTH